MSLTPVDSVPLSRQIHRQLVDGILAGTIAGTLPSERELAETFGVNRHAVREAIKRLEQGNLIEVNQGGATRVLPLAEHARLDILPELIVAGGSVNVAVLVGVLQLRACVGADAARLCAERSPETGDVLLDYLPTASMDDVELAASNLAYWAALVAGAQSLPYQLALNTLMSGVYAVAGTPAVLEFLGVLRDEFRRAGDMEAIARAIGAGDGAAAQRAAQELLQLAVGRLT